MSYWYFKKGKKNNICDVKGVLVGHITKDHLEVQTGLNMIRPHGGNLFREKVIAASHVINGFGKPMGLIQINELGTLETPILLTNTLAVGEVTQGLISFMVSQNQEIGKDGTVNPVVLECNDGVLNDIRTLHISKEEVAALYPQCKEDVVEGPVGAGRGMVCYDIKGGIGSASRIVEVKDKKYTVGVLVMSNFGSMKDLMFQDRRIGKNLVEITKSKDSKDKGSIIVILATDAPFFHRQLLRLAKRTQSGIARTGGYTGNGSGEIALAFSTGHIISSTEKGEQPRCFLSDDSMDFFFQATVEATEEAILKSLYWGETVVGHEGRKVMGLRDLIPDITIK